MARPEKPETKRVTFRFIKTKNYTTYFVDGAYGGITPRGLVSVALYHERFPIPNEQTFEVSRGDDTVPSVPVAEDKRDGFVRIVEAQLVMSPETAASMGKWLIEKAREAGVGATLQ